MAADDYCEFSGLTKDSCHHCRPGKATSDTMFQANRNGDGSPSGPLVVARHPGRCPSCGERIIPDETRIAPDGNGRWVCEDCR